MGGAGAGAFTGSIDNMEEELMKNLVEA